jgi:hypothetical protein
MRYLNPAVWAVAQQSTDDRITDQRLVDIAAEHHLPLYLGEQTPAETAVLHDAAVRLARWEADRLREARDAHLRRLPEILDGQYRHVGRGPTPTHAETIDAARQRLATAEAELAEAEHKLASLTRQPARAA